MGPAAFTAYGAFRNGLKYSPILNLRIRAFLEWLRLTLPLMVGVSLTFADKWIYGYFASGVEGGILTVERSEEFVQCAYVNAWTGCGRGFASLLFFALCAGENGGLCGSGEQVGITSAGGIAAGGGVDGGAVVSDHRSVSRRLVQVAGRGGDFAVLHYFCGVDCSVVGAGYLLAEFLCGR